mgnify:CR=1 FL=1
MWPGIGPPWSTPGLAARRRRSAVVSRLRIREYFNSSLSHGRGRKNVNVPTSWVGHFVLPALMLMKRKQENKGCNHGNET